MRRRRLGRRTGVPCVLRRPVPGPAATGRRTFLAAAAAAGGLVWGWPAAGPGVHPSWPSGLGGGGPPARRGLVGLARARAPEERVHAFRTVAEAGTDRLRMAIPRVAAFLGGRRILLRTPSAGRPLFRLPQGDGLCKMAAKGDQPRPSSCHPLTRRPAVPLAVGVWTSQACSTRLRLEDAIEDDLVKVQF